MTATLSQIIAAETGVRSRTHAKVSQLHHDVQRTNLTNGLVRTYQPKDEDGQTFPPENSRVQVRAEDALVQAATALSDLFDVTLTRDAGNQVAKADIEVRGSLLAKGVPVTTLLFLEKQLADLYTFVRKLPTLDGAEAWRLDPNDNLFKSDVVVTHKTRKVPRNHVKAEATDRHPAQVEVYYEDVVIGFWHTIKVSGAVPAVRANQLAERVAELQQAVKFARERANATEVPQLKIGETLLGWVLNG